MQVLCVRVNVSKGARSTRAENLRYIMKIVLSQAGIHHWYATEILLKIRKTINWTVGTRVSVLYTDIIKLDGLKRIMTLDNIGNLGLLLDHERPFIRLLGRP